MGSSTNGFDVIPVLDIANGQVVRAYRGQRRTYRPWLDSVWGNTSDPRHWIRQLKATRRFAILYLADLDALEGKGRQWPIVEAAAASGLQLWYEGAVRDAKDLDAVAERLNQLTLPNWKIVVGLETWCSPNQLPQACRQVPVEQLVFSVDLFGGSPMGNHSWGDVTQIVQRVSQCGIWSLILLELDRVGTATGNWSLPLVDRLKNVGANFLLYPGGGIASADDLEQLRMAGCAGALVGTALHTGQV